MLLLMLVGCDWFSGDSKPVEPPPPVTPAGPALPAPPRVGVAEVTVPPELVLPTEVVDRSGPVLVDVWLNPDLLSFDELGARLDGWGLTRVDGDGEVWRVRGDGGPSLPARLAAAEGVGRAREALDREPLPNGAYREGSARFGEVGWSFTWAEGPPVAQATGATVPAPALPRALPPAALACFAPLLQDLEMGLVTGPGYTRALSTAPLGWAVVVEHYGFCDATGWVRLDAEAPVAGLSFGDRPAVDADDALLHDLATRWLGSPRSATDPMVIEAVGLLSQAPDAALARAMRDSAPGAAQERLYEAFAARDPEAALAVAAGSASPVVKAQAVGQDEVLRLAVLADPAARSAELYAALAAWRPGPSDPPGLRDRLLASRDPRVRARAWEILIEASEASCATRVAGALDQAGAEALYRECPQSEVRAAALARVRALDATLADTLLTATLRAPETIATGIAAVAAADAAGRRDLLAEVVANPHLSRAMRREALTRLVRAGAPQAPGLVTKHGEWLGYRPAPAPGSATADGQGAR